MGVGSSSHSQTLRMIDRQEDMHMEALTFIPVATAGQIDTLAALAKEVWT